MKKITDKEYSNWLEMKEFIKWNYQKDLKNKLLGRIHNLVSQSNADLLDIKDNQIKRLMNFKFDENQLIQYLTDFLKDFTGRKVTQEDRGYISEFVMMKKDNFYEVKK